MGFLPEGLGGAGEDAPRRHGFFTYHVPCLPDAVHAGNDGAPADPDGIVNPGKILAPAEGALEPSEESYQ